MSEADVDTPEIGSAAWWAAYDERLSRRRPRAGGLTVEQILDEAIELLDAAGLEGLTVRELTGRLGTSSASLYRHVASVDELLVLVIDRVLGEVRPPDPGLAPRARVIELSLEFRRVLRRHPGVVPALRAAPLLGPNAMRGASSGLTSLLESGLEPGVAVAGYLALIDYVLGSVFFDTPSVGERARAASEAQLDPELEPHRRLFAQVQSDNVFRIAIEAFLDGLPR